MAKNNTEEFDKNKESNIRQLINNYKKLINEKGLSDELYKWKLLKGLIGKPDINSNNFELEIRDVMSRTENNLVYQMAKATTKLIATRKPEEYKSCFKNLFNEELPLKQRIEEFQTATSDLYQLLEGQHSSHHDERTISLFLTFHNPEKYTFYKSSYYEQYCKHIGVQSKVAGEKYVHYLELMHDLIDNFIIEDTELLSIIDKELQLQDYYPDNERMILAQDILYQMFSKNPLPNYWIFQANPDYYNLPAALKENVIRSWKVNQFKKEIKEGDKLILWMSGQNAGIYALATIDSSVQKLIEHPDELRYYKAETLFDNETERVEISIDYNLVSNPVLKKDIITHPILQYLTHGRQGTNFKANENQYNAILKLIRMNETQPKLNQILYGPPGTGKTYNTINEALKIADPEFYAQHEENREILTTRFRELLIRDWENPKGQIAFCTFHQSYSYEDFVEGIKPRTEKSEKKVYYEIENGVFKNICMLGESNESAIKVIKEGKIAWDVASFKKASFFKISLGEANNPADRIIYEYCRDNGYISIGFAQGYNFSDMSDVQIQDECKKAGFKGIEAQSMNYFKNYIKKGNYVLVSNGNRYVRALGKVTGDYEYKEDAPFEFNHFRKVEWIFVDENIPVEEIYDRKFSQVTLYKIDQNGLNQNFFTNKGREESIREKEKKKYVLIIDEINRGNVSSIFGELITLIEKEKRSGGKEELEVTLPYSKSCFKVPENVYIIGTMNTADRSIEALDTALRRRFSFVHMEPKSSIIKDYGKSKGQIEDVDVCLLLDKINERIEKLIDKDHRIGHSYFMDAVSIDDLKLVFRDAILPLLQEYFFGDNGKIGLVLGSRFIEKVKDENFEFAAFADYDGTVTDDLKRRSIYAIKPESEWDFSSIYEL